MSELGKLTWEEAVAWLKRQPESDDLIRDCYYDDSVSRAALRFYESSEWRAVRRLLPAVRGKALDLGAGRGISSFALVKDGWHVTSLEPDSSNLVGAGAISSLAAEMSIDLVVVSEWGEALPFDNESFDLVYCRAVLHHANDLNRLCSEVARVLKPEGCMIATREHVISTQRDLDAFLRSHPLHLLYGGEHAYKLRTYLSAIRDAGLTVSEKFNSYQSDINLFPASQHLLRKRAMEKFGWPGFIPLPRLLFSLLGYLDKRPGRLYTFVAKKV